jgi:hypothetical protein
MELQPQEELARQMQILQVALTPVAQTAEAAQEQQQMEALTLVALDL